MNRPTGEEILDYLSIVLYVGEYGLGAGVLSCNVSQYGIVSWM